MPWIGDDYHKTDMIKKRTPSNLGYFLNFDFQSVMGVSIIVPLLTMIFLSNVLFLGCSKPADDEQLIRESIKVMVKAAEIKSSGDILSYLAEDFMGNRQFRKTNIKGMLFVHFRRHKNVHVFLHNTAIEVAGLSAQVNCQVILAGRGEELLPEQARVLEINSRWQKLDGKWLVVSASWKDPYYQQ